MCPSRRRPDRRFQLTMLLAFLVAVMGVSPLARADLVQFRINGTVRLTNTPLERVEVGTRVRASFLVDTSCTPEGVAIEFSGDPDPVLLQASTTPVFRDLNVRLGRHRFSFDLARGQLFVDPADPQSGATYRLTMNLNVNSDQPDFINLFTPGLRRTGPIFASDLPSESIAAQLAAILAFFDESPLDAFNFGGGLIGATEFDVDRVRVRVLRRTPPDLPCPTT